MRLQNVRPGDIVLVDKKGRKFHGEVRGRTSDGKGLRFQPLQNNISWREASAHEIDELWRKARAKKPA